MKEKLEDFTEIYLYISEKEFLRIDLPDKLKNLNRFSWCKIIFCNSENEVLLLDNDYMCDYMYEAISILIKSLNNTIIFPEDKEENKGIGFYMNLWSNNLPDIITPDTPEDPAKKYWLFSTNEDSGNIQTFIYTIDNEIYIEISQSYNKWSTIDSEEVENFISFEEFIENYQMITRFKLDKNIVEEWKEICEIILKILENNTL